MSEWIPCSERMPSESEANNLLVYIPKRDGVHQSGIRIGCLKSGCIKGDSEGKGNIWGIPIDACDWSLSGWSYFEKPMPSHWMPLPEQPCHNCTEKEANDD